MSLLLFPSSLLGMMSPTPLASTLPCIAAAFYISIPSLDTFTSSCSICPLSSVAPSSSQSLGLATCKIILDISPHLICFQSYWMYFPVSLQSVLPIFISIVTALIQAFLISKSFLPEILPLYFLSISPSLCLSFTLTVSLSFVHACVHTHTPLPPEKSVSKANLILPLPASCLESFKRLFYFRIILLSQTLILLLRTEWCYLSLKNFPCPVQRLEYNRN